MEGILIFYSRRQKQTYGVRCVRTRARINYACGCVSVMHGGIWGRGRGGGGWMKEHLDIGAGRKAKQYWSAWSRLVLKENYLNFSGADNLLSYGTNSVGSVRVKTNTTRARPSHSGMLARSTLTLKALRGNHNSRDSCCCYCCCVEMILVIKSGCFALACLINRNTETTYSAPALPRLWTKSVRVSFDILPLRDSGKCLKWFSYKLLLEVGSKTESIIKSVKVKPVRLGRWTSLCGI